VKKDNNPDTRRVVAQLLDYAAALWGMTVDDFERDVLRRKLGDDDSRSICDFIMEDLLTEADDPEEQVDSVIEGLGETLRTGNFALARSEGCPTHLANSGFPARVQGNRQLEDSC
jgi:hypothetical protein